MEFLDHFNIKEKIGRGAFGSVWIAEYIKTPEREVAVKVIDRKKLKPKDDEAVYKEINVMRELSSHAGVIKLYHFFENVNTFHIVLELARGGDVFSRLSKRSFYPENDARKLAKNLLTTIEFIHSKGFVHRDLKPENLLLETLNEDSNGLKIADFGFARKDDGGKLKTRCGTPSFVAPEICVGVPYDKSVDMWSCGVILFLLLGGYPPFQDRDMMKLFRKIRAADYSFLEKYWDPVSTPAKQLIVRMLTVDPSKRITAADALKSKWICAPEEDLGTSTNVHLSDTVAQLKKFLAKQKLRGAIIAMSYATTAKFWTANTVSFMSKQTTFTSMPGSIASSKNLRTSLTAGKALKNFDSLYHCQYKIRGGRIAEVWQGCKRDPDQKQPLAIKIVQRKDMDLREEGRVMNEVAILQSLSHPNILALHDFFEETPAFYIVMELMKGGDVFDRIVAKSQYTEKDARVMAHSLLCAVDYFHGRGIAHRDLKPQNLLLQDESNDSSIKVADFSFAKRVHTPKSLFTRCGTPTYVAPEILKNHPHDQTSDLWSVGVIIYVTLVGYPPFMEEDQRVLFKKIRYGEYTFYEEDWVGISQEAKDLIRHLLVVDPDRRMTASNALLHSWFKDIDERNLSLANKVPNIRELKDSIGDTDKFHQPHKNFKSFKELPNEPYRTHITQHLPESMNEKVQDSTISKLDEHTGPEPTVQEEQRPVLIEEENVYPESSFHSVPDPKASRSENKSPVSSRPRRSPATPSKSEVILPTSTQARRSPATASRSEVKPFTSTQVRRSPATASRSEVKPSTSTQACRSPTNARSRSEVKPSTSTPIRRSPTNVISRSEVKSPTSTQARRSPATASRSEVKPSATIFARKSPAPSSRSEVKPSLSTQARKSSVTSSRSEVKPSTSTQARRSPANAISRSEVKPSTSTQARRSPANAISRSEVKPSLSAQARRSPATASRSDVKSPASTPIRRSVT